jgi:hypothetical protein
LKFSSSINLFPTGDACAPWGQNIIAIKDTHFNQPSTTFVMEIHQMKTVLFSVAAAVAFAAPAFADTSAAELFAMSNNSAAETIVRETSMGDIEAARISLALGNMSAAEREAFFAADMTTRMKTLEKAKLFGDGNSAAEMAAVLKKLSN